MNKVEHIIEPTTRIGRRPLVQLGLHPNTRAVAPWARTRQYSPVISGINVLPCSITLEPFAMWPAFPAPDYYGSSAPPRRHQSTTDPTGATALAARVRGPPGWFPRSLSDRSTGGAQLCPCSIAMVTPQTFTMASRQRIHKPPRSSPPAPTAPAGCAPHPAHIRQI